MDGVRKEKQALQAKIKQLDDALKAIDNDINSLMEELKVVSQKRDKAYESFHQLRKQRDEGVGLYFVVMLVDPSLFSCACVDLKRTVLTIVTSRKYLKSPWSN